MILCYNVQNKRWSRAWLDLIHLYFFSFTNGALRSKSVMLIKFLQASTLVVIHLISNYYLISL